MNKSDLKSCDCEKTETAKHFWEADNNFKWDQTKVVDRESMLILRNTKESIYSLKNPNHINKISQMLAEMWLPNLQQVLAIYFTSVGSNQ